MATEFLEKQIARTRSGERRYYQVSRISANFVCICQTFSTEQTDNTVGLMGLGETPFSFCFSLQAVGSRRNCGRRRKNPLSNATVLRFSF